MHTHLCICTSLYILYNNIYNYITIHNATTELGSKSCFLQGWSLEIGNSFLWRVSISRFVLPDGKMEPHRKFGRRHMISVNMWDFLHFWQFSQPYGRMHPKVRTKISVRLQFWSSCLQMVYPKVP